MGNIHTVALNAETMDYRMLETEELEKRFGQLLSKIRPLNDGALAEAGCRWNSVAKPLGSLGLLEDQITQIAGITGVSEVSLEQKALVVFCADNGVVEERVTQTGQEVTAVVTANFTRGDSCACLMAERAGTDVYPVDIGVAYPLGTLGQKYPLLDRRIRAGTDNFTKGPAMTRREALTAILTGAGLVRTLKNAGYNILATGEMGIGNTTTSSAVASVLLGVSPAEMTGRGAGLSDEGLSRKINAIERGIRLNHPDPRDGLDVLTKVGGFDLAGLAGVFLGGAANRIPIVIDGFISAAAAAAAVVMEETVRDYMLAAHVSAEPAGERLLRWLGKRPAVSAGLCLGEGTGALTLFPLLDMTLEIYQRMSTFSEIEIEAYQPF